MMKNWKEIYTVVNDDKLAELLNAHSTLFEPGLGTLNDYKAEQQQSCPCLVQQLEMYIVHLPGSDQLNLPHWEIIECLGKLNQASTYYVCISCTWPNAHEYDYQCTISQ